MISYLFRWVSGRPAIRRRIEITREHWIRRRVKPAAALFCAGCASVPELTPLADAIAPFIIVGIQKNFSWRAVYYFCGSLGVVWVAVWYRVFEDTPSQKRGISPEEQKLIGEPALRKTSVPWSRLFRDSTFLLLLLMYHCYCYGAYFFSTWFHTVSYLPTGRPRIHGR